MMRTVTVFFLLVIASFTPIEAKPQAIDGVWTLSVERLPLRMVLALKGHKVSGTLDYPHGAPFQLTGSFDKGKLAFSGDSSGENFTIHIDATGSQASDGSLGGTIVAHIVDRDTEGHVLRKHDQDWTWTAVRAD
jgi:hypothetical protein